MDDVISIKEKLQNDPDEKSVRNKQLINFVCFVTTVFLLQTVKLFKKLDKIEVTLEILCVSSEFNPIFLSKKKCHAHAYVKNRFTNIG